jgi:hypothetical protein
MHCELRAVVSIIIRDIHLLSSEDDTLIRPIILTIMNGTNVLVEVNCFNDIPSLSNTMCLEH